MDVNAPMVNADMCTAPEVVALGNTVVELRGALQKMVNMHALMVAKTNFGASFYNAECIQQMNEVPVIAQQLLDRMED